MNPKYSGQDRRQRDELELKTAFGSIKAAGAQVMVVIVILAVAGALGYQEFMDSAAGKERAGTINKQIDDLKDAINEQTFILTLTNDQRQALRLDMPESLRKKLRNDR